MSTVSPTERVWEVSKRRPTTALIVGAGAVVNAWLPILRAVEPHVGFPLTPDGANSLLARLVYLLRWWAGNSSEDGPKVYEAHLTGLRQIRTAICHELRAAQAKGEISIRPEFQTVVHKLLLAQSTSLMLVNTNWDTVVDDALEKILRRTMLGILHPQHVHGDVHNPAMLYLPTEVTKEPYRSKEEDMQIGALHGNIIQGLEKADRVVIYGLSLSPLDAELNQTLAAGWSNPRLKEIHVVVPNHDEVAHRVNLLLNIRYPVVVKGYDPSNLDTATDYSITRVPDSQRAAIS